MKKRLAVFLICLTVFVLCGCCLSHEWQEATCTEPKTCSKCGKTEGEALGHIWEEATCVKPKTCSVCGEIEGEALGHQASPATCIEASVCSICGETVAKATGHKAAPATCTEDPVCSVCGETVAKATGHDWVEATVESPKTCKNCGLTEGDPLEPKYFDMSFSEYMKKFNSLYSKDGWKLEKVKNRGFIASYSGMEFIVFNLDTIGDKAGLTSAYSTEEKEHFNRLMIRYVDKSTSRSKDNLRLILAEVGTLFAYVLDPDFFLSTDEYLANMSTNSGGFVSNANGITYKLRSYDGSVGLYEQYIYDFDITI